MSTGEAGGSRDGTYFAAKYEASADPWGLRDSRYEQRKYACTVAMLPNAGYRRGFEPGCSIGVLSGLLARRCERLLCWDIDPRAVETAKQHLSRASGVVVEPGAVPGSWPASTFDLIVISELAYYLRTDERLALWTAAATGLQSGGTLAAVHWRRDSSEHCCNGDVVHAELGADPRFRLFGRYVEREFLIDVLVKREWDG